MGDRAKLRVMIKAGTARTNLTHKNRNNPQGYNRQMLDFIYMCINSGDQEAILVAEQLDESHTIWQKQNGFYG